MNNLRGLLGIRRMDRVPNAQTRELRGVVKLVDEGIGASVLRWFGHIQTMGNKIAKRVYVGECVGSHLVGRPRKRWIDSVKDFE